MPGDDKGPDLIRVKDSSSNSKADTFEIEPKAVGKEGNTQTVRVGRELEIPQFDDPTNAPQADGLIIWVTGDGSDPQGLYQFDGSSFVQTGGGAPTDASYVTTQAEAGLSNETVYGESLDVEDLGTQGTDGQVPTANASGGIDMESPAAGTDLQWTEDGNSPLSITSSTSGTYTFASNWDGILLRVVDDSDLSEVSMQVNGDTGSNYTYVSVDGTETTGATTYNGILTAGHAGGQLISMNGRWEQGHGVNAGQINHNGLATAGGRNLNVNSPLNQFTLNSGTSFSVTIEVYGTNG